MTQNDQFLSKPGTDARNIEVMGNLLTHGNTEILRTITALIVIITGWGAASAELFLRRELGKRYFGFFRFLGGVFGMSLICSVGAMVMGLSPQTTSAMWFLANAATSVLFFIYLGLYAHHRYRVHRRQRDGVLWYTRSIGYSRLEGIVSRVIRTNEWNVYSYVEPVFCVLLGYLASRVQPLTIAGIWLAASGLCLLVHNGLIRHRQEEVIDDLTDAMIESRFYQDALQRRPRSETAGISVVSDVASFVTSHAPLDRNATLREVMQDVSAASFSQASPVDAAANGLHRH